MERRRNVQIDAVFATPPIDSVSADLDDNSPHFPRAEESWGMVRYAYSPQVQESFKDDITMADNPTLIASIFDSSFPHITIPHHRR